MLRTEDGMECAPWRDALDAFLDGELGAPEARQLELHLVSCGPCREELRFAEEIRDELRSLPMLDAPEGALPLPTVADFPPPAGRSNPSPAWRSWAVAAGLGMLVLTLFWWLGAATGGPDRPLERAGREETLLVSPDLAEAEAGARLALAYVGRAGRRAGIEMRDTVLREAVIEPVVESLTRRLPRLEREPPTGQLPPSGIETS